MDVEGMLHRLNPDAAYEKRLNVYWASWPYLDVRAMAELMVEHEVRLVTMTGTSDPAGGLRLIYHWDHDGTLINLATRVASGRIQTISDIVPAADWVERELRDYYGSEFDGRANTPPLMLREGDPPGLFTRTADQGRDEDPAQTAHAAVSGKGDSR